MKVNSTGNLTRFSDVPIGGVFSFQEKLYMKTDSIKEESCDFAVNSVSLCGYSFISFLQNDFVNYYPNANLNLV
jgi:hypothetical protein